MAKFNDLTGVSFNKLTVIKCIGRYKREPIWECLCTCGATTTMRSSQIKNKVYFTCGCMSYGTNHNSHNESSHGKNYSKEYKTWSCIKRRCLTQMPYIKNNITVCNEWAESFEKFLSHIGRAPTSLHTIDRIDNAKGYEPGNVRWATMKEQQRNKTNNHLITFNGESKSISQWAEELSIGYATLYSRITKYNFTIEEALTKSIRRS